jgi:hypothetical protein
MARRVKELNDKPNKLGTFISRAWQKEENKIILMLADYLDKIEKLTPGVLVMDGIMAERVVPYPCMLNQEILRRCEVFVLDKSGFKITLVEKLLTPTSNDYDRLHGPRALERLPRDEDRQIYLLTRQGKQEGIKRRDGFVMKPHEHIPGVYIKSEENTVFINRVLKSQHCFRTASMRRLTDWFGTIDNDQFQLLTPTSMSTTTISFLDGYFDLDTLLFHLWTEVKEVPKTDHFFEIVLCSNRDTPKWDELLETQLGERTGLVENLNICDMLEVLIGRVFYPVGKYDNWQVMPFLKGDGNTGKSTILDLVTLMLPIGSVGVITSKNEKTFGLEELYNKRAVIIPDLPSGFENILSQSDFQSMITGEPVSIARKNKTAISNQKWVAQLLFAGNFMIPYNDTSGSISRRIATFLFNTLVESKNTNLKDEIVKDELVAIMMRCIGLYRSVCETYKGLDFWTRIAPLGMRNIQDDVKQETNYLSNFLSNGDSYYQILRVSGEATTLENLDKAFSNHMKFTHKQDKVKIGSDYYPIKAAGFTIKRVHLCKHCHHPAGKETCGDHYDASNRYRRFIIFDMQIKTLR